MAATGPDFVVKFPSILTPARECRPRGKTNGGELNLHAGTSSRPKCFYRANGVRRESKDFDIRVENKKVGAGCEWRGDQPLWKVVFCPSGRCLCPEATINMKIEPARVPLETHLRLFFYTFAPSQ